MARRRYQKPSPELRGDIWYIRLREDEVQKDGSITRIQRRVNLGSLDELPNLRMAQRAAEPYLFRVNSLSYRPRHVGALADFTELYKRDVLPQLKPSTQSAMRSVIAKQINPSIGHLRLHEVQPEIVQRWIAELGKSGISAKTVRNCFVTLRSIWRALRNWGRVQHDAFAGVVLPRIQPTEVRCFTEEEIKKIILAAPEPYKTFYWLAAETGLRAGEICALRWDDIDLELGQLHIWQALSKGKMLGTKSHAGRRVLAISPQLTEALAHLGPGESGTLVFKARNGHPWISDMVVKRKLKPLLKSLGIPPAAMHAFRHFHATIMDRLKAPTAVRKARMGHTSLAVTDRYTHLASEDERQLVREISDRIVTSFVTKNVAAVM